MIDCGGQRSIAFELTSANNQQYVPKGVPDECTSFHLPVVSMYRFPLELLPSPL